MRSRISSEVRPAPPLAVGLRIAALALVAGCSLEPRVLTECSPGEGPTPICGFHDPEDLAVLPGGAWVAISQLEGPEGTAGSLVGFRNSDGNTRVLFPPASEESFDLNSPEPVQGWGDPACAGPPDRDSFAPHGIDVTPLASRSPMLAAVNHGGREAIELFEVAYARGGPALGWRGCIPMPDDVWANDVAILRDGSLVATNMMSPPGGIAGLVDLVRMLSGGDTGDVLAWRSDTGWVEIAGSNGAAPNGIAVSADGLEIYFAEWSASRLVRLRLDAAGEARRVHVDLPHHPDNLSWTRDGHLLVTGQIGPIGDVLACARIEVGTCALPFSVLRIEPATLESELVLRHEGVSMGAGTAALQVGDEILIGTFAGDRIARAPYDP